jgi:hypothetical protein
MKTRLAAGLVALLALTAVPPASADRLGDLRAMLQKLQGDPQPIRAQIAVRNVNSSTDDGDSHETVEEGQIAAEYGGAQGLRMSWTPQQIRDARQAERQKTANPDAPSQKGGALSLLDAREVANLLDAAEPLQLELDGAKLLEDKVEPRSGRPTRVLVLQPRDGLRSSERKMLKGREAVLKLWLDESGVPVALDHTEKLKFTKFLINFSVSVHESRTFSRVGNRLVVTGLNAESSGSGLGQSGKSRKAVRVAVGA